MRQPGGNSQWARYVSPKALVAAAVVLALVFVGSSSAARTAHGSTAGKAVSGGVPKLGAIVRRRLPPFIAYDSADSENQGISLMRGDGSDSHAISSLPAYAGEPSWSPAGTRILFTTGCAIGVANADGSNQRTLISAGDECSDSLEQPRWSPNGKSIVYSTADIQIAKADGSHDHLVPHTEGGNDASYSPDGRYIVFDRSNTRNGFKSSIYVIRTNGTGLRRITRGRLGADPSWSPDGTRIVYGCSFKYGSEGHLVAYATTAICEISRTHPKPRRLYSSPDGFIESPKWSADGKTILVTYADMRRGYGGETEVALLAPSGGSLVAITHGGSDPDW